MEYLELDYFEIETILKDPNICYQLTTLGNPELAIPNWTVEKGYLLTESLLTKMLVKNIEYQLLDLPVKDSFELLDEDYEKLLAMLNSRRKFFIKIF